MKKRNRYFNGRWPIHSAIPLSNWIILPRKKNLEIYLALVSEH